MRSRSVKPKKRQYIDNIEEYMVYHNIKINLTSLEENLQRGILTDDHYRKYIKIQDVMFKGQILCERLLKKEIIGA